MSNIVDLIRTIPNLRHSNACTQEQIQVAQKQQEGRRKNHQQQNLVPDSVIRRGRTRSLLLIYPGRYVHPLRASSRSAGFCRSRGSIFNRSSRAFCAAACRRLFCRTLLRGRLFRAAASALRRCFFLCLCQYRTSCSVPSYYTE